MKTVWLLVLAILLAGVLPVCAADEAQNKVIFDNQSGEPALVKLIGPTSTDIEVPTGAKVDVDAAAGKYIIKVRYGAPSPVPQ